MNTQELVKNIQLWSKNRRLDTADPKTQMLKVIEEVGELSAAISRQNTADTIDGIGDVFVTIVILAQQLGIEFDDCALSAWNEIKDRIGILVNGTFIKEDDLIDKVILTPTSKFDDLSAGREYFYGVFYGRSDRRLYCTENNGETYYACTTNGEPCFSLQICYDTIVIK